MLSNYEKILKEELIDVDNSLRVLRPLIFGFS